MNILYRIVTALVLDTGIAVTIGNSIAYARAELTGMGTDLLLHSAALPTPPEAIVHVYERAYAAEDMVIGMLLILLGFCLHALMVAREERRVPITVVSRKRFQTPRWFWIEMRI